MGDQQRQRYQVQLSLRQKYQQQLEQLRRDSEQKGTYNTDDYRKAEQALTESLNRQLNENRRYWQQLEVVQGNWKNGVLRAFQDFTVDADNTAGTAEQVFSSAFSNMGNGLATFVTTGKLNFKSFTSSVLSDMAKILAQATMMKSIKGIGSVMETFHWKVRPDMNVVSEPKVVTVKLGDGYEQRRAAGLNNQLSIYSVTIRVRKCEHPSLKAFLERHGGVRAFQWTPPYDWKPIRVVCRKWSASVGALWVTITADFEQVVA